jgi:hypothetical protein
MTPHLVSQEDGEEWPPHSAVTLFRKTHTKVHGRTHPQSRLTSSQDRSGFTLLPAVRRKPWGGEMINGTQDEFQDISG